MNYNKYESIESLIKQVDRRNKISNWIIGIGLIVGFTGVIYVITQVW